MINRVRTFFGKYNFLKKNEKIILYFIFGSASALVDLIVFFVLVNFFEVDPVFSTVASISCATIIGFALNAILNFQIRDKFFVRFFSYSLVSGVGVIISSSMLYYLHEVKNFDANIIKIISLPIIFIVQYTLNSRISFFKKGKK